MTGNLRCCTVALPSACHFFCPLAQVLTRARTVFPPYFSIRFLGSIISSGGSFGCLLAAALRNYSG